MDANGRKNNDGVKCVMRGGSGAAARPGFTVMDSQTKIAADIEAGVTEVITREEAAQLVKGSTFMRKGPEDGVAHSGSGVVEMD